MKFLVSIILLCMLTQDSILTIIDFKDVKSVKGWQVVNDGVMGGLSKGQFYLNENDNAVFEGFVTTENNGGFSSVRYPFKTKKVSDYASVNIKLKGDGKRYEFRIKSDSNQEYSYIQYFETSGDWQTISIPLSTFYPSYRGQKLKRPNYEGQKMEEIAFLIGNGKKESFQLEVERIYLE